MKLERLCPICNQPEMSEVARLTVKLQALETAKEKQEEIERNKIAWAHLKSRPGNILK